MQLSIRIWSVALVLVLVCFTSHVSGVPTEMQSDDWRASSFLQSAVDQYIKPYTKPVVERVTNSAAWTMLGSAVDRVQGAMNVAGGFMYTYYEDHLKGQVESGVQKIKDITKPLVERVQSRFQKEEQ